MRWGCRSTSTTEHRCASGAYRRGTSPLLANVKYDHWRSRTVQRNAVRDDIAVDAGTRVFAHECQPVTAHVAVHGTIEQSRIGAGRRIDFRVADADHRGAGAGQPIEHAERGEVAEMHDEVASPERRQRGIG